MPNQQEARDVPRVPAVLPLVHVAVGPDGNLSVEVDHEPHPLNEHEAHRGREALGDVLNDIAIALDAPVRVELLEHDGTKFTDIVRPDPTRWPRPETDALPRTARHRSGFIPSELIDVAVVVGHVEATSSGNAEIDLPPSLVSKHPGHIVLLGANSGTLVVLGHEA